MSQAIEQMMVRDVQGTQKLHKQNLSTQLQHTTLTDSAAFGNNN